MQGIAIGLIHLLVMDIADAFLGFGGFLHVGIEQDEIFVLGFSLSQTGGAPFSKPTVGDGELGLGQKLAAVVGVDEGLEGQPGDLIAAMLDVVNGPVEQHFVGLFGLLGDGVCVLMAANTAGTQQARQGGYRNQVMKKTWIYHSFLPIYIMTFRLG